MKPLLISFSGGRTSAYMTYMLMNLRPDLIEQYQPYIVFANTGCEHPKTLEFVKNCADHFNWDVTWLEAKVIHEKGIGTKYTIVNYETASKKGEPYEQVIKKYSIPCVASPHCTRELKQAPIRSWCKDKFGVSIIDTAIGIRADEQRRINRQTAEKFKLHYPLFDDVPTDKQDILNFWETMPFDLEIPEYLGNCVWCFKKSDTKLIKALDENPDAFDFPLEMEQRYPLTKQGKIARFFRGNRTVNDLIALKNITDTPPIQYLTEGGCSESCEFVGA